MIIWAGDGLPIFFFCFHTQRNSLIKVDIHDDFCIDLKNGGMKDV